MSDAPATGEIYLVTGIMAAGKSTVANALAQRFERGVHVRGDMFRKFVVRGRVEMSADPSMEARRQLELRYDLAAHAAAAYAAAGFTTVVQDIVLGTDLPAMVDRISWRPLRLIVLAPTADTVARREAERAKTGYRDLTPDLLDEELRERTPRLGLWLDTSDATVDETVDEILRRRDEASIR